LANDDPASPRHAGSIAHIPFGKDNFPKTPFKPSQNKLSICDENEIQRETAAQNSKELSWASE